MSTFYLDASALVKRYVDEAGSDWLRSVVDPSRDAFWGDCFRQYSIMPVSQPQPALRFGHKCLGRQDDGYGNPPYDAEFRRRDAETRRGMIYGGS